MLDITQQLQVAFAADHSAWYIFTLAFFAGVLVSFTPCIYPMIPITAGILQAQASKSLVHNFLSALCYIFGIAIVYASLGYLSATTSIVFGKWFASPFFIAAIIIFFLYLAFSMFGFYEFYMPQVLQFNHNTTSSKATLLNSFLLGLISGTFASPCLTPALAILLGIVAKQANPAIGFIALLCFALGMGILLLLIGTFSATITLLPHAGEWMNKIKSVCGFLILAACVYFAQIFLDPSVVMASYAVISCIAFIYYLRDALTSRLSLMLSIIAVLTTLVFASSMIKMLI